MNSKFEDINKWSTENQSWINDPRSLNKGCKVRDVLNISSIDCYCFFRNKFKTKPNGIYTILEPHKSPIDRIIWWDFIITSELGFIHVWRTKSLLEFATNIDKEEFDVGNFLEREIKNSAVEIEKEKRELTIHSLYINHYDSYKNSLEYLYQKYEEIDLKSPKVENKHIFEDEEELKGFSETINNYTEKLVLSHTLGKSVILNAAFLMESTVNLLLQIGTTSLKRENKTVYQKALRHDFKDKLKTISFYTPLFEKDFDLSIKLFKDAFNLMTLRNKYVHSDSSSELNKVGEVLFDEDYPIFEHSSEPGIITNLNRTFGFPDKASVDNAYKLAIEFEKYIIDSLSIKYREQIKVLLASNPIGFNEDLEVFSAIFNSTEIHFGLVAKKK